MQDGVTVVIESVECKAVRYPGRRLAVKAECREP